MPSTYAINPLQLSFDDNSVAVDIVIQAVYRQVLGNTYVMESERLVVPESQLRMREFSVREFVRQVAKSDLYRSRFFEPCSRYRSIELNFKHLLGRAPADFAEMRAHSNILDRGGYDAEIDSYLDSDEYQDAYGDHLVPFERGFSTQTGLSMQAVTNMRQLVGGAAGSDKQLSTDNRSKLQQVILRNAVGPAKITDVRQLLADLFQKAAVAAPATPVVPVTQQIAAPAITNSPEALMQQELASLRSMASVGAAMVAKSSMPTEQTDSLSAQLAEARALASIAEYRLNKWRSRTF